MNIYKNRRRQSSLQNNQQQYPFNHHQKFNLIRAHYDSENRDLVTVGNNDEIFVPTFQVLNEEENENIVQ